MKEELWNLEQNEYNSKDNRKYETLFTLANGYRGLRGTLEFSSIGERGNFISGIFDKSDAQVTEIVNCQDPLGFNVCFEDEQLDFDRCNILKFKRRLNMKEGILYLSAAVETEKGKRVKIESERYVSQKSIHRWAD
ncbi:MAG: glycoside hydrolase family 65 protein, partial [Clostridiaceae bacterium]